MDGETSTKNRISGMRELFLRADSWPIEKIEELALTVVYNFKNGKKIAFVGNGGSAAEAMHFAAEFTGKCVLPHDPWPAICINESQSALTAIANDFGHEFMFSRQVEAFLEKNDILILLSTSGKSRNILTAIETALDKGVQCYLWTGITAPKIEGLEVWSAPSNSTPRIQELHLAWGHLLAERVEELMN